MRSPLLVTLLAVACTSTTTSSPTPSPSITTTSAPAPTTAAPTTATATPAPATFGGEDVAWPRTSDTAAPPALGAVVTVRVARATNGTTLAARLTLPRIGGTASAPVVMTPCGRTVTLSANDLTTIAPSSGGALPKAGQDVLVVVDPGHGGPQLGAVAPDGDREKDRTLQIATEVRRALGTRVGRVVLTR